MEFNVNALRSHLEYSNWASRRLVDAAGILPADDLTRDFGTADRNILGTLVHIYAADRVWLARIRNNPPARFMDTDKDMRLEVLRYDWPRLLEDWLNWATGLTDESASARVHYTDLKGNPYETPIWQIVLHVVNHATHHRGQVSGFLRTMGHTPPPLDLMAYYRSLSAPD
jgi:uncharacterized damage-inducible protein DinB